MKEELTFKFILLGNSGVGKSCLATRFSEGKFTNILEPTVGANFYSVLMNLESTNIKVHVWDTAGQELFRSITRSYYRDSRCAIIVYDVSSPDSFDALSSWIGDIRDRAPPSCQIALVGNKIDEPRIVSRERLQTFAEERKCAYFETSALTGENVREMFEECAMMVYAEGDQSGNSKKPQPTSQPSTRGHHECC